MNSGQAKRKLIYQIYPTAVGDLRDIADKIPYIAKLKPDYIWLSPIFTSPWIDGGYDVADYCAIDPRFGNFKDFGYLIKTAKKYNIEILLDLVINHTSDQHLWFQKSRLHDRKYRDYYVWLDKPLNWNSMFGGPAFSYDQTRQKYYLHIYDKAQPDLNFKNPKIIKEFRDIIDFWKERGVAGFRVDSANILAEKNFNNSIIPRLAGFFSYYHTKDTIINLEKIFADKNLFTVAEPVGGNIFFKRQLRELTAKAFTASFNVGTLDVADTFMSQKNRIRPVNYKKWLKKLTSWSKESTFSLALESHDTPRSPSRFNAQPKSLAMLQFLLPSNFPCVYQGQELGTKNPILSNNIDDYPGVQSRMIYRELRREGKSKAETMRIIRHHSRDNARQAIDWGEYITQERNTNSVLNFYEKLTKMWRNDPVLISGDLKVKKITKNGEIDFERRLNDKKYRIHIDLKRKNRSYLDNEKGQRLIAA